LFMRPGLLLIVQFAPTLDHAAPRGKIMRHGKIAILAIGLLAFATAPFRQAVAIGTDTPEPPTQPTTTQKPAEQPKTSTTKKKKPKQDTTPQPKNSSELFLEGYRVAYALIYGHHDYEAGIAKLKSLGHDEHADVATLIGYSSRKLGRYDDAKYWYEKALAADPKHARTWSYYGMWHAEQGNLLKAREYLAKVQSICGTGCREYAELKGVIEGTRLY